MHVYGASVIPPLQAGAYNVVQRGRSSREDRGRLRRVPERPAARDLARAGDFDRASTPATPSYVVPDSASSADTSGVVREGDGQYVCNLAVRRTRSERPALHGTRACLFGGSAPALYAVLKIK